MGSQQPIVHFLWILLCDGSALKELPVHSNRRQWNAVGIAIMFQCVQRGLRNGAVQKPDMELFPRGLLRRIEVSMVSKGAI